jgi:rod shape-determining protein MreD
MSLQRGLAYVALAYVALIVVSSLEALIPFIPGGAVPEVSLLLVIHLGLGGRGSAPGTVGVAMIIGYLVDLFSGSPRGLHALSLGLVMVAARGASSRLMVSNLWQQVVVTLLASLGHGALLTALSSPMYDGDALQALRLLPATALSTAAIAPFVFAILRRADRRLIRDPHALRIR